MSPKDAAPQNTDDIVELTDIVEPGVLPEEDAAAGLTDASFEDELDAMLADAPELSAAGQDILADAPAAAAAQPAAQPADSPDSLTDLDSLLEELGDGPADSQTPPPPPAASADAELLDVDELLAEMDGGDSAELGAAAQAEEEDIFADLDASSAVQLSEGPVAGAELGAGAGDAAIDASAVDVDDLLAELEGETRPSAQSPAAEDDLLAELKSVMGDGLVDAPAPELAPDAEPILLADTEPTLSAATEPEASEPAALLTEEVSAVMAEVDLDSAADQDEPMAVDETVLDISIPESVSLPEETPEPVGDAELQHLDALLDDILQPGPEAAAPIVEPGEAAAAAAPAGAEPAETAAQPAGPGLSLEALMAEDGPLRAAVRDLVRRELDERVAALEARLSAEVDKAAAKAAAKIIREEIAALAQEM